MKSLPRRVFVPINGPDSRREELRAFAMACVTLDIPLRPQNCFVEYRRTVGGEITLDVAWFLEQKNPQGTYKTNELWLWWNDAVWLKANPNHPIALFHQLWRAMDMAKRHEQTNPLHLAVLQRGRLFAQIPRGLPAAKKERLIALFKQQS